MNVRHLLFMAGIFCVAAVASQDMVPPPDSKVYRELKADTLIHNTENGDGIFLVRSEKTRKWGLVQIQEKSRFLVPAKYDSIIPPTFNAHFVQVRKDNLWGIYVLPWATGKKKGFESVHCVYNSLIPFEKEGCLHLAGQYKERWIWLDWYSGMEFLETEADSFSELENPGCSLSSEYYAPFNGCPGCI